MMERKASSERLSPETKFDGRVSSIRRRGET